MDPEEGESGKLRRSRDSRPTAESQDVTALPVESYGVVCVLGGHSLFKHPPQLCHLQGESLNLSALVLNLHGLPLVLADLLL
jgi:hypothetical protein